MTERLYRVLFLCTGNSARSIMAECALNRHVLGRFEAHSAGSHPKGQIHPTTLEMLERYNYRTAQLRSKSWDEFAAPGAPALDFVFTVCDNAAGEVCPIWPGQPMTAHWGVEDPAAATGSEIEKVNAFRDAARFLRNRINAFAALPLATIDRMSLQSKLKDIGKLDGATGND
jgi:arsenate reductase